MRGEHGSSGGGGVELIVSNGCCDFLVVFDWPVNAHDETAT